MDLKLTGKVALVTGGSRGIGRASALALAAEGADVAIVARDPASLAEAAAAIAQHGVRSHVIAADVTDAGQADRLVGETVSRLGRLDILVANAGGTVGGRELAATSSDDWGGTYALNVLHAINLLRAAVPAMTEGGAGSAIFIASISGRAPVTRSVQYAAAKAALIQAARSLAWELAPNRIRVNALSPGSILFEGGGWERTQARRSEDFSAFERDEFPWGRLGTLDEVAAAVAFLASPRALWINGSDLAVDGGQGRPSMR